MRCPTRARFRSKRAVQRGQKTRERPHYTPFAFPAAVQRAAPELLLLVTVLHDFTVRRRAPRVALAGDQAQFIPTFCQTIGIYR